MQERVKALALGEEVEKPMNVHRWRHLEGADPAAHELLLQTQALQRRLIAMTEANVEKGMQLQEHASLIAELQGQLAARPGQEAILQLSAAQAKVASQAKQVKALTAELRMLGGRMPDSRMIAQAGSACAGSAASTASADPFAVSSQPGSSKVEQRQTASAAASGSANAELAGSNTAAWRIRAGADGHTNTAADVMDLTDDTEEQLQPAVADPQAVPDTAESGGEQAVNANLAVHTHSEDVGAESASEEAVNAGGSGPVGSDNAGHASAAADAETIQPREAPVRQAADAAVASSPQAEQATTEGAVQPESTTGITGTGAVDRSYQAPDNEYAGGSLAAPATSAAYHEAGIEASNKRQP